MGSILRAVRVDVFTYFGAYDGPRGIDRWATWATRNAPVVFARESSLPHVAPAAAALTEYLHRVRLPPSGRRFGVGLQPGECTAKDRRWFIASGGKRSRRGNEYLAGGY